MGRYEYTGQLHIHSNYSDGGGSIPEIARAGRKAGLDFVAITDHNTLGGRRDGFEGWQEGILVLIGQELGYKKNHYIALGTHEAISADDGDPQRTIDAVNAQGGFGYLAHPAEKPNPAFLGGAFYAWDRWDAEGFCGLEIWNFSSLWREAYRSWPAALFWYWADRYRGAAAPEAETIRKWDQLALGRPVVAFGGTDAHAFPVKSGIFKLSILDYKYLFRTINTHLLLKEELSQRSAEALRQVLGALRLGAFFIGSDYLFPTRGFRFAAYRNGEEEAGMGEEARLLPGMALHILSPSGRGTVRIIHNGKLIHENRQRDFLFPITQPGVFRAEVYWRPLLGKAVPWIYSNAIYVKD